MGDGSEIQEKPSKNVSVGRYGIYVIYIHLGESG